MAAEAVGVSVGRVEPMFSDTATTGDSGSASASRLTWMCGNAILGAAEEADKAWRAGDRPAIGEFRFVPPPTEALDPDGGASTPNFAYSYGAQAVDLSVDVETGHIVVHRVVCAHDVGKIVNPDLVVGQIEGGVVQAHGYAITEDLQVRDGRILNPRLSTYLMPGILDIPERIASVVEERRSARAVGRARRGRDADDPVRPGRRRRPARRHRRVVRRLPPHPRSGRRRAARRRSDLVTSHAQIRRPRTVDEATRWAMEGRRS